MGFYKRREEIIQAHEVTPEHATMIAELVGGQIVEETDALDPRKKSVGINIPTLNGMVRASVGDYVCKGNDGTISKCPGVDFKHLYELIEI